MTIHILFLMRDDLPPFRADVQALFGKYLPRLNISSDILGQYDPNYGGEIAWPAGQAISAGPNNKGIFAEFLRPFRDFAALLTHHRSFDIIQVRDKIRTAAFALIYAHWHKKPFVYWMSFPFVEDFAVIARNRKNPSFIMKVADFIRINCSRYLFYNWILPNADHIFVQSEAMKDWLTKKGFEPLRMTAVPMGIDSELIQHNQIIPSDDPRLIGRRVILYAGSVSKSRHSEFMLDLALSLKELEPKILLVLAGDAPSAEEQLWIREEINKRNLQEYVLLTGWLSQEQAFRYLARAEVGVSPIPRGELFDISSPTKLVEYLALGIPSVANDIPDQKLVIQSSNAGICVPMEISAFQDAIMKLLCDTAFHHKCAENGPKFVNSERTYTSIAGKVAQTYKEIIESQT